MLLEHLIFSTAIAIIAGMVWYKRTGRDPSWIIIASAFAPDFDSFSGGMFKKLDMNILIDGSPIRHGDFHNIAFLLLFATVAALVLRLAGMRFRDAFLFAGIGFAAHMFEDALVANPAYAFFWPLSDQKWGIGIIEYRPDWYGIANTDVLILGLITVLLCAGIRVGYEGKGGIKRIGKAFGVAVALMILMIPVFGILDVKVMENVNSRINSKVRYIDSWSYTQNASWDSTVFHNGSHSGKIQLKVNESNAKGEWRSIRIPVKPETTYIFSAWEKTEGIGGNYFPSVAIEEINTSGRWINQTELVFGKGNNDWIQKEAKFKTKSNTIMVFVYVGIWKGYGTVWFDDVEFYKEGSDINLISNSGLELN